MINTFISFTESFHGNYVAPDHWCKTSISRPEAKICVVPELRRFIAAREADRRRYGSTERLRAQTTQRITEERTLPLLLLQAPPHWPIFCLATENLHLSATLWLIQTSLRQDWGLSDDT